MEVKWKLRPAVPQDADGLQACMISAYGAYRDRMDGAPLPPLEADYATEISVCPVWVMEARGKIVGGLIMSFQSHRAKIANIAVDPACQGQGMGGALLRFAESAARERGFDELHLVTHVLLHENVSLYRHLGWQETHREQDRVFMRKAI